MIKKILEARRMKTIKGCCPLIKGFEGLKLHHQFLAILKSPKLFRIYFWGIGCHANPISRKPQMN